MKDFMNWFNPLGQKGEDLKDQLMDMTKMNEFVQKSIEEALSPVNQKQESAVNHGSHKEHRDYKVVELMKEVVVTIQLPADVDVEAIRLSIGNGKLFVDGIGFGRVAISLPAQTSRRNIFAEHNEGMIEVRLPKRNLDEKEIFLHY